MSSTAQTYMQGYIKGCTLSNVKALIVSFFSDTKAVFFAMAADWPICATGKAHQPCLRLESVSELLFQFSKYIILIFVDN